MKEDVYGPAMRAVMERTSEPLSATELQKQVTRETGPVSQARVYAWVAKNRPNMVAMGKTATGGTQYVWRTNPLIAPGAQPAAHSGGKTARTSRERDTGKGVWGVEAGQKFTITNIRVLGGEVVIELTHDDSGAVFDATLHL